MIKITLWRLNWWLRFVGLVVVLSIGDGWASCILVMSRRAARKRKGGFCRLVGDSDYESPPDYKGAL